MDSPYNTSTPQAYPSTPATPGMMQPLTPGFTDSYDTSYDGKYLYTIITLNNIKLINLFLDSDTLPSKIEVRIKDNFSAGSAFTGKIGVILDSGSTPQVKLYSGQITYVPVNCLEPTIPAKKDRVKIISGEHKNVIGTLTSVSAGEAAITTDSDTMIMVNMSHLGKYVP